jgi:hypothetical protein
MEALQKVFQGDDNRFRGEKVRCTPREGGASRKNSLPIPSVPHRLFQVFRRGYPWISRYRRVEPDSIVRPWGDAVACRLRQWCGRRPFVPL